MKLLNTPLFFFAIIALLTACQQTEAPKGIKHFYVIGIDALSVDGLETANTPNIDRMIREGAYSNTTRAVLPTTSAPNWSSMLMGTVPDISGYCNDWDEMIDDRKLFIMNEQGQFPTILSVIRAQMPEANIGMHYEWKGFGDLFEKRLANEDKHYHSGKETTEGIAAHILQEKPYFIFSQIDFIDEYGHEYNHMSEKYLEGICLVDSLVGTLLSAIEKAGIADETVVMLVADHGGIGNGHGGTSREEQTVPLVIYGKGVKRGYKIPSEIFLFDVAPTIAFALNVETPYVWRGRPIKHVFDGFDAPLDPLPLKRFLPEPKICEGRPFYSMPGGLFIDSIPTVSICSRQVDGEIYYTIDGSTPTRNSIRYEQSFKVDRTTVVKAKSFSEQDESYIAEGYFRVIDSARDKGVSVKFYPGNDWKAVPAFYQMKSTQGWTEYEIYANSSRVEELIATQQDRSFGLIFESQLLIDEEGVYKFYLQSDDGSNLYIDDRQVVNNDGNHGVIEKFGKIKLTPGLHNLRVEFINGFGGYWIEALYSGPGVPKQVIPADKLFSLRK